MLLLFAALLSPYPGVKEEEEEGAIFCFSSGEAGPPFALFGCDLPACCMRRRSSSSWGLNGDCWEDVASISRRRAGDEQGWTLYYSGHEPFWQPFPNPTRGSSARSPLIHAARDLRACLHLPQRITAALPTQRPSRLSVGSDGSHTLKCTGSYPIATIIQH